MLTHVHIFVSDVQQSGLEPVTFVNNKGWPNKINNNKLSQPEHEDWRRYLKTEETKVISFRIVVLILIFSPKFFRIFFLS